MDEGMDGISVRRFRDDDAGVTARIFFDAIHLGTRDHYDAAQRRAWAPRMPEGTGWLERLRSQTTLVAERDRRVLGFMTVRVDGYIDLAFVAPAFIGTGVAGQLYRSIVAEAAALGVTRLHTQASHVARPFFERRGWSVVKEQTVSPRGVPMTNFLMEKVLG